MVFTPNALCFGGELPAAGAPCHVEVSSVGLRLDLPDSRHETKADTIPFAALSLEAGGFDHDHLVVRWTRNGAPHTLYLKDPALLASFWLHLPPELMPHLERTAERVRRSRMSRRAWLITAAGAVLGMILALWLGSDALVKAAVHHIPVEWERAMGDAAQREFLAGQTLVAEGPAVTAVREILDRLTGQMPNSPYRFTVTLVRSDTVNAFALPGGSVVVFTGLLKQAKSPEEVAGVLSHEVNHVLRRHGLERTVRTAGLVAVVTILVGNQQGLADLAKRLGIELLTLKFSREQETEADLTGLRLLHQAKIAPSGLIRFFERLAEGDSRHLPLLSTHPMSAARAARLKAEAAALPPQEPVPFSFDWQAVQQGL